MTIGEPCADGAPKQIFESSPAITDFVLQVLDHIDLGAAYAVPNGKSMIETSKPIVNSAGELLGEAMIQSTHVGQEKNIGILPTEITFRLAPTNEQDGDTYKIELVQTEDGWEIKNADFIWTRVDGADTKHHGISIFPNEGGDTTGIYGCTEDSTRVISTLCIIPTNKLEELVSLGIQAVITSLTEEQAELAQSKVAKIAKKIEDIVIEIS